MPSTCVFQFDRPNPIYYGGEVINGRITLTTTSVKTVNEIYILFEGEAKVHWTKRDGNHSKDYRGNAKYINTRTAVFGKAELPVGTHTYTCSIPLPLRCPTFCEEKYGKIKYELSLVIDRPWRFNNVFHQPIRVLQIFDLNNHPEYLIPIKQEDIKHFCCWPCSSGSVISTLTIPFGGYVPGQDIKYSLEIDNQSPGYEINGIKIALQQTYRFLANEPREKSKERTNTIAEAAQDERVLRLTKRVLNGSLSVPRIPPTSQDEGIIMIRYTIEISIKTGDCQRDSNIAVPIIIGTIPLVQSVAQTSFAEGANILPQQVNPPPDFESCMPPKFQDVITIGDECMPEQSTIATAPPDTPTTPLIHQQQEPES